MNQQAFELGKQAYNQGDFLSALNHFSVAAESGVPSGELEHLRGNAYLRLGQYDRAIDAYSTALQDKAYGNVGALCSNRGRACLAAGKTQEAIASLSQAVQDPSYQASYKAHLALGSAYESVSDIKNAGIAYRAAAIDEANPAPSTALCSLGSCFMRLSRPLDAVEAYRTALDFVTPTEDQHQIWCYLALAYVAANRMHEAVDAFGHATADGNYQLSPNAQASYDAACRAIAAIKDRQPSETDAFLEAAGYGLNSYDPLDPTGASGELMPSPEDTGFFTMREEDMVAQEKAQGRKKHHIGLKIVIVLLVLLIIAVGTCIAGYVAGFGFPTQESVVTSLFDAKTRSTDITQYLATTDSTHVQDISNSLPSGATIEVIGLDRSMNQSSVYLTASLAQGGTQNYVIQLVRDGISWKVSDVSLVYAAASDTGATIEGAANTSTTSTTSNSNNDSTTN